MKRGPLSNDEKSYIEKNSTKTVTAISKKINRSETIVAGHLETVKDNVADVTITHNLFARKKDRGVVVMPEAASMVSDENKSKRKTEINVSSRHEGSIHKIKYGYLQHNSYSFNNNNIQRNLQNNCQNSQKIIKTKTE